MFTPDLNNGDNIFVFGSNMAGLHGKGAALEAKKHWGAIQGRGRGIQGQSYAIPTKDYDLSVLPLLVIGSSVRFFLAYAAKHPRLTFLVTPIGCGLAGYTESDIRPMFDGAPLNCVFAWEEK